uniref:Fibronectin type-III domain-containing protein n=1 Tax=Amphimedon queenslandica TaxID=400682 RepID=A0A1X7T6C5_AMPQE
MPITVNGLILDVTKVNSVVTSTATYQSINESLNGTLIGCIGVITDIGNIQFKNLTIDVTDPPVAVNNISINPINKYTMIINWLYQNPKTIQCIVNYTVIVNDSNGPSQQNYSSTGNNPNITIPSLTIGTNYSFIIIPIDTIGREGPPSSLIQYIWNVPAQVVNISWDQISTDSITIWWDNNEDSNTSPPINNYTLTYNNNSQNTTNTNITITGLPLTDTNYTVSIIPVNIIGYGPSATVNGTVDYHTAHANISRTATMTSTSSVMNSTSSVTLTTDISTSNSLIYIPTASITVASSIDSSSYTNTATMSTTPGLTPTGTSSTSTTRTKSSTLDSSSSTMIPSSTISIATGSNAVPIISGAIGTVFVIIIIIIIALIIILVYAKRHSK